MLCPPDKYHTPGFDRCTQTIGSEGLLGEVEPFHRIRAVQSGLVLRVDDAARDDASGFVGQEQGHPRIGQIDLPLIEDSPGGTQNGCVGVDFADDMRTGSRIDAQRDRAPPTLLDLVRDQ